MHAYDTAVAVAVVVVVVAVVAAETTAMTEAGEGLAPAAGPPLLLLPTAAAVAAPHAHRSSRHPAPSLDAAAPVALPCAFQPGPVRLFSDAPATGPGSILPRERIPRRQRETPPQKYSSPTPPQGCSDGLPAPETPAAGAETSSETVPGRRSRTCSEWAPASPAARQTLSFPETRGWPVRFVFHSWPL